MRKLAWTAAAVLMLSACAQETGDETAETAAPGAAPADAAASASDDGAEKAEGPVRPPRDPYPSTYKPYPGETVLLTGATVLTGTGERIENGSVLIADGKVSAVGAADSIEAPEGAETIDAEGKWITPGIIDIHSHLGDYPSPSNASTSDGNEIVAPNTAYVWAEHSVWPQDAGFTRALAGGITSLQILPGSANLFGGRSAILKNVPSRTVQGMKFPDAPYGLKMACGENPKRVYGERGGPDTRMGNMAGYRAAWIEATAYKKKWDDYWKKYDEWADSDKKDKGDAPDAPARDLKLETLAGVLRGDILVNMHCYRADEMVQVLDMAEEFGYKVSTFHHAIEAYKIADYLAENDVCAAVWADWWGFKLEAFDTVGENAALVDAQPGGCAIIHSDDALGIQRLNQEAAKAMADGRRIGLEIEPEDAIVWLTANPAKAMGIGDKTGALEAGKMADVVVWNGNPFSVYAKAEKVYIDGALMYDRSDPSLSPRVDFELGLHDNGYTGGAGQ
ncbi:amidohydrolase [Hyphococcus luteus]|uniref:Amidohydrolase n=1 Tax=Hyphococcus luteus TaxID=2058213 RepID=A0A2S7K5I9_9PROT|nr:amidohydrolase [Marinicaulis flavus]PQA87770.1 amidohydrolase [Marinicaulis flavus]